MKMFKHQYQQVFKIGLVIIFAVVYIPHVCVSLRCPYKCKCSASSIICVNQELMEVPDFKRITSKPTAIDLSENEIEEITNLSFNFKNLGMIISLKLHDNSIFDIEIKAFSTLPKLQHLDLSNNLIEDFQGDLIVCNKELMELKLAGNLFGSKTPEIKSESLEVLDLSFSKLSQFSKDNVEGLPNLRYLYLQANNLIEIDYTIFGTTLQFIDLAFNAWKCHCDTITLFDYLVKNNLTVISNPVQCVQSFRRYEDVYDYTGPIRKNKWCENKAISASINYSTPLTPKPNSLNSTNHSVETCIDYKIWVGVSVFIIGALVASVCLIFVLRCLNKSNKNERPKNTAYNELSIKNINKLQNNQTENIFSHSKIRSMA